LCAVKLGQFVVREKSYEPKLIEEKMDTNDKNPDEYNGLPEVCTIREACRTEKCGRTSVYKRINEGHYVAYKTGSRTLLDVASLRAYRKRYKPRGDGSAAPVMPSPKKPKGHLSGEQAIG
jgi:hypothetical protein